VSPYPIKFIPPLGAGKRSARARVLAQWRGLDLNPLEKISLNRVRSAENIMPKVLSAMGIDNRRSDAEVVKVWNSVLDPNIAKHAQPVGLRKGTLFVNVDSSVWLSEIVRYRRKEILRRLQYSFGAEFIKKISFRVG